MDFAGGLDCGQLPAGISISLIQPSAEFEISDDRRYLLSFDRTEFYGVQYEEDWELRVRSAIRRIDFNRADRLYDHNSFVFVTRKEP